MNAQDYRASHDVEILARLLRSAKADRRILRAVLELTYRCNFKCPHCYVHTEESNHACLERELSTTEWKSLLGQLRDEGCLILTFTGGEVFCRRDFIDIARHARELRFLVRVFTNASYVDDGRADLLAELDPEVEVSLYGASPATYRAVAGHEIYLERACQGIDRLRARGLRVQLKTPLLRQNYDDLEAIEALARERWGLAVGFGAHTVPRDDRSRDALESEVSVEQLQRFLQRDLMSPRDLSRRDDSPPCTLGRDYLVISPFGDVFPCVNIKRSVGNVREQPIKEIWDNAPYLNYLRSLRVGDYRPYYTPEEMKKATLCPGAVWRETGSPVGVIPFVRNVLRLGGGGGCGCGE